MLIYLPTAPAALIDLHKKKLIKREYATLGRLLTDERMKGPWRVIEKRTSTRLEYLRLWKEIDYQLQMSRRVKLRKSRAQTRAHFRQIAKRARLLVAAVP